MYVYANLFNDEVTIVIRRPTKTMGQAKPCNQTTKPLYHGAAGGRGGGGGVCATYSLLFF